MEETVKPESQGVTAPAKSHRYDAFISYSHKADAALAKVLQNSLEKWAKPWYSQRTASIFRDETALTATPHLWPTIVANLDSSMWLILLASTTAADSKWVAKEVCHWVSDGDCDKPEQLQPNQIRPHRAERIMLVLTDGEIAWNNSDNDFDWSKTTALPKFMTRVFDGEPRWVDLTWARKLEKSQVNSHDGFYDAVTSLLSPMRGKTKEELLDANDKEQKRTIKVFRSLSVGLIAGFMLAIFAAFWANAKQKEASLLAAASAIQAAQLANDKGDRELAAFEYSRALHSLKSGDSRIQAARRLINGAMDGIGDSLVHDDAVISVAVSTDGKYIATGCNDGRVFLWNADSKDLIHSSWTVDQFAAKLYFAADARFVVAVGMNVVRIFDVRSGRLISDLPRRGERSFEAVLNCGEGVVLWRTADRLTAEDLSRRNPALSVPSDGSFAESDDNSLILTTDSEGKISTCDLQHWFSTGPLDLGLNRDDRLVGIAPDKKGFFVERRADLKGQKLEKRRLPDGRLVASWDYELPTDYIEKVLPDEEFGIGLDLGQSGRHGSHLARLGGGLAKTQWVSQLRNDSEDSRGYWVDISRNLMMSIGLYDKNAIRLWQYQSGASLGHACQHPDEITSIAFSKDMEWFVTGCADGRARRWRLPSVPWPATNAPASNVWNSQNAPLFSRDPLSPIQVMTLIEFRDQKLVETDFRVPQNSGTISAISGSCLVCSSYDDMANANTVSVISSQSDEPWKWTISGPQLHCFEIIELKEESVLAAGDFDGGLHLWRNWCSDAPERIGESLSLFDNSILYVEYNASAKMLAVASKTELCVFPGFMARENQIPMRQKIVGWPERVLISNQADRILVETTESRPSFGVSRPIAWLMSIDVESGTTVSRQWPAEEIAIVALNANGSSLILERENGYEERDCLTLDVIATFPARRENVAIQVTNDDVYEVAPGMEPHIVHRFTKALDNASSETDGQLIRSTGRRANSVGKVSRMTQAEWLGYLAIQPTSSAGGKYR